MLVLGGAARERRPRRARGSRDAIASGRAARVAERMIEAQGGDPRVVADRSRLAIAAEEVVIEAPRRRLRRGSVDALEIGLAAVAMGAGRTRADQAVDPAVGIFVERSRATRVARGEPLARLVRPPALGRRGPSPSACARRSRSAANRAPTRPLVLDRLAAVNSTSASGSE